MRFRRVPAPDRNLQGVDRLARPSGAKVDTADQQVRLRFVRREKNRTLELSQGFAVLLLREKSAAALQVELRDVFLIALRGCGKRLSDAVRSHGLELLTHALETAGDRRAGCRVRIARRHPRRELALAGGLHR